MTERNILLAGVGGQGTVLASKLLAACAIARHEMARTAETIGMAQRGGSVVSHVRIGESSSPLIPLGTARLIIGFEPAEAVRVLPYLAGDGAVIVNRRAIQPVTASLSGRSYDAEAMLDYLRQNVKTLCIFDGDAVCAACGSPRVLNVALLGAAAARGALGFSPEELTAAMQTLIKPKFLELNLRALRLAADQAAEEKNS